jgi:RNA polymerase sigma factor for flagellar operon FliA
MAFVNDETTLVSSPPHEVGTNSTLLEQFVANRSPELREKVVLQSVPLVHYLLGRLGITKEMGSDYEDLVHQGLLGLIDAVDRFDPKFGTKFSTYASLRIRGKILDYLRVSDWMPRSARQRVRNIQKAVGNLWMELGREPTEEEIAANLGLAIAQVEKGLYDSNLVIVSLDATVDVDQEGEGSLHERLVDEKQSDPSDIFEDEDLKHQLMTGIRELSEREQVILSLYYFDELTFKEIGRVLGITESRVCQLHARAIVNLKAVVKHE